MEPGNSFSTTVPDNTRIRAAMAAFAANPTADEALELTYTMLEEHFVVLLPMAEEPDGSMAYSTAVEADQGPILHVFTSLDEVPPLEAGVEVYLKPYADLIMDLLEAQERWNGVIIDPNAMHSVTVYFKDTGGYALYSTALLRAAVAGSEPGLN